MEILNISTEISHLSMELLNISTEISYHSTEILNISMEKTDLEMPKPLFCDKFNGMALK
jgi:hypothetical protein